jgi:hypothetical protein
MTPGHYASHPDDNSGLINRYEKALERICKARQISHAKSIAREAIYGIKKYKNPNQGPLVDDHNRQMRGDG